MPNKNFDLSAEQAAACMRAYAKGLGIAPIPTANDAHIGEYLAHIAKVHGSNFRVENAAGGGFLITNLTDTQYETLAAKVSEAQKMFPHPPPIAKGKSDDATAGVKEHFGFAAPDKDKAAPAPKPDYKHIILDILKDEAFKKIKDCRDRSIDIETKFSHLSVDLTKQNIYGIIRNIYRHNNKGDLEQLRVRLQIFKDSRVNFNREFDDLDLSSIESMLRYTGAPERRKRGPD